MTNPAALITGRTSPKPCEHLTRVDCKTCGKTAETRLREVPR